MEKQTNDILLSVRDLNVFYGGIQALHGISLISGRGRSFPSSAPMERENLPC